MNAHSQIGETPLHGAAIRGFSELAAVLAAAGANLDAVDKDNMSPIDYAMARFPTRFLESKPTPYPETAAALRKLGAKRETTNPPNWPSIGVPRITAEVPILPY